MKSPKYFAIIVLLSLHEITCSPIAKAEIHKRNVISESVYTQNSVQNNPKEIKKDVFLSRGWGAGGMPFSVLYLNHSSKNTAPQHRAQYKTLPVSRKDIQHPKSLPQVRNSMGSVRRKPYSIIPQLFVSYGWGPLGKGK